jgi:ubiquinone/menaquinone biosynthesis C-methylase UbiE
MHAEAMEFPDESFDVALCMNSTLGNMPGIEQEVIHEMIRVTRKGGEVALRVFADTPAVREAQYENYARLGLTNVHDVRSAVVSDEGFYSRRFDVGALEDLFRGTGFTPNIIRDSEAGYLTVIDV